MKGALRVYLPMAGLVLCTATQWRLPNVPLGLGELLMAGWLLWVLGDHLRNRSLPPRSDTLRAFTLFWGFTVLLIPLGIWSGYRLGVLRAGSFTHDLLAYGLALSVSLAVAALPGHHAALRAHLRAFTMLAAAAGALLWLSAQYRDVMAGLDYWYGGHGVRFRGWSANPNQMSLLLAPLPFLILQAFVDGRGSGSADAGAASHVRGWTVSEPPGGRLVEASSLWRMAGVAGLLALVFAAGVQTNSNALHIAWMVTLPLQGLLYLVPLLTGRGRARAGLLLLLVGMVLSWLMLALVTRSHVAWSQAVEPSTAQMAVIASIPSQKTFLAVSLPAGQSVGEDTNVRFLLVQYGLQAVASSPLVGLGPGAHSGMRSPFEGSEVHNSLIDWGTNFGLAGALAMVGLVGWVAYRLYRAGHYGLLLGLLALCLFSMGHHVLRHPLTWAYLVLASKLAEADATRDTGT